MEALKKLFTFLKKKAVLIFWEVIFESRRMKKLFNPNLKKLLFFYANTLGFFITVSSDVLISPLVFNIVFGCFHC